MGCAAGSPVDDLEHELIIRQYLDECAARFTLVNECAASLTLGLPARHPRTVSRQAAAGVWARWAQAVCSL